MALPFIVSLPMTYQSLCVYFWLLAGKYNCGHLVYISSNTRKAEGLRPRTVLFKGGDFAAVMFFFFS